jgi:hypothetical protein
LLSKAVAFLITSVLVISACTSTAPADEVSPQIAPTPDTSGTVAAAVQATLQTQASPSDRAVATAVATPVVLLDEHFAAAPQDWPNQPLGVASYARFHKSGGPPGGGYGLVVDDEGTDPLDGVRQTGQYIVLEASDQGQVGAWQRDEDRWIDLQPWTPSPAVHQDTSANDLMVRVHGGQVTFLVNGSQVLQISTKVAEGRVEVFVGGDGNRVTLEYYTIASTDGKTHDLVPLPSATEPLAAQTPSSDALLSQLDDA